MVSPVVKSHPRIPFVSEQQVFEAIQKQQFDEYLDMHGFLPHTRMTSFRYGGISNRSLGDDAIDCALAAATTFDDLLTSLTPLGPFRRTPERWYAASGDSLNELGYRGSRVPELLFADRDILQRTNGWLERLQIGYRIVPRRLGLRTHDFFEIRLVDTRLDSTTEISMTDVGFGISQILPFIVQCIVAKNQTITIEQPEVHIHPRLQADIGELTAASASESSNNCIIAETHSEHLVLRIQKLVRLRQVKPENVSILYVSRGKDGSKVDRLRLDADGDFIDEWPGGFFPERMRELQ